MTPEELPTGVIARIDVCQDGVRVNLRNGMTTQDFASMLRLIAEAYEEGSITRTS